MQNIEYDIDEEKKRQVIEKIKSNSSRYNFLIFRGMNSSVVSDIIEIIKKEYKNNNIETISSIIKYINEAFFNEIFRSLLHDYDGQILNWVDKLPIIAEERKNKINNNADHIFYRAVKNYDLVTIDKLFCNLTDLDKKRRTIDKGFFSINDINKDLIIIQLILSFHPALEQAIFANIDNEFLKQQVIEAKEFSQKLYQIRINNPKISIIKILQMKEYAESKDVKNLVEVSKSMLGLSEPAMDIILKVFDPQNKLSAEERREVLKAMAKVSSNQQKSEVSFVEKILQGQVMEIAR
ncbi:hypothetical protein NOVO_07825 [Rickettsiales bacterium Ac37b]|nr:hypothetical protein NOVO_07825 [Rickettsiales bacterium Ac37b]